MDSHDELEQQRRSYAPPHSGRNPIPTIQQYRQMKEEQRAELDKENGESQTTQESWTQSWKQSARDKWHQNQQSSAGADEDEADDQGKDDEDENPQSTQVPLTEDTSQTKAMSPKEKRKQMQRSRSRAEREVTDPVTHLPVKIRDFTSDDMKSLFAEEPEGSHEDDERYQQIAHSILDREFPPPEYNDVKLDLDRISRTSVMLISLACPISIALFAAGVLFLWPNDLAFKASEWTKWSTVRTKKLPDLKRILGGGMSIFASTALFWGSLSAVASWAQRQTKVAWDDALWSSQKTRMKKELHNVPQETTLWFNKLVGSIWPLINPDLFISVSDTLEDVMQASLPTFVRMVSVEDLGQGSEPFRILGIKWLPKGAAHRRVSQDGVKASAPGSPNEDKSKGSAQSHSEPSGQQTSTNEQETYNEKEEERGLEAAEGDFVNLEIAFAYRASPKTDKHRSNNAHLYLAFYLPGNIKVPVWVELRGLIGCCRVRLQLTPDPPFFSTGTVTLLGQPDVDISCVPLVKKGLNIMDLPFISNFVQGSVNAALSEYVAPKSISLDLQAMLVGDDFKRDTTARGVLVVRIKRAFDFKAGDASLPGVRKASSDPYVSIGWAKLGKPLWSTRIMIDEMHPYWEETGYLLVTSQELEAEENLRVQLWDSDKYTADDDLGRIELELGHLMQGEKSRSKMWDRTDSFRALEVGKTMPGKLEWSVGYFPKLKLSDEQVKHQLKDKNIQSVEQLRNQVYREAERKLRETSTEQQSEAEQLKREDWEAKQIEIISDSKPPEDHPSGILSITIHQIVGLEVREGTTKASDAADEHDEEHESLPSGYCTIILNHQKIFKTRTKPKNAAPFYNACAERYVRDWRHTSILVSCRDARVHEDDALLGFIHLDLGTLLRSRETSRLNELYPLMGGIGVGRMRISLVFRAVQMQAPAPALGWDWGTIEVDRNIVGLGGLPNNLCENHLSFRTELGKIRAHANRKHHSHGHGNDQADSQSSDMEWSPSRGKPILLPVRKRYAANLMVLFRNSARLFKGSKTNAYAVFWLRDLPDEQWTEIKLPVYQENMKHALSSYSSANPESNSLGFVRLRVRFWRGLSMQHEPLTKRSLDVENILEVLKTARDMGEIRALVGMQGWRSERDEQYTGENEGHEDAEHHAAESDVSDSEDEPMARTRSGKDPDDDNVAEGFTAEETARKQERTHTSPSSPSGTDGSSLIGSAKEFLDNRERLNREHRGLMQWKGTRTGMWMKHKTEKFASRLSGTFEHQAREPDIETET